MKSVQVYTVFIIIGINLTMIVAEPMRFRQTKRLTNFGAQSDRNERVEAPYPPAGVTPVIPFDLPTETDAPITGPEPTYSPPEQTANQTYLPPVQTRDQADDPTEPTPTQTYGPPQTESDIEKPSANLVSENQIPARSRARPLSSRTAKKHF